MPQCSEIVRDVWFQSDAHAQQPDEEVREGVEGQHGKRGSHHKTQRELFAFNNRTRDPCVNFISSCIPEFVFSCS